MKRDSFRALLNFILILAMLSTHLSIFALPLALEDAVSDDAVLPSEDVYVMAEEESKRGTFEKHYLLSDGSFIAVSYPEAVHYLSENGSWEEVDNRLSFDKDSFRIINGESNFDVSFADSPNGNSLATLSHNGQVFSWGLSAAKLNNGEMTQLNVFSSNKASIIGGETASLVSTRSENLSASNISAIGKKANDTDVFISNKLTGKLGYAKLFEEAPEISVEYSVYHNKIEEDIFINAPTDLRTFTMNIQVGGLTAHLNNDGSVDFLDENGDMQYRIGIPYMVDANHEVLNDIEVKVNQDGNSCSVTYEPNEEWLTSEDRVYPILLDPSITTKEYNSNITDTYVVQGNTANHSAEQGLYYGVKSGKVYRTYIKINNLPNIDASMPVIGATMKLNFYSGTTTGKKAQVYKVSNSWNAGEITYSNQPQILSSNLLSTCNYNSSVSYLTFDLSQDVATIYNDFMAANNYGYVVKYEDESNTNPDYNIFYSTESTKSKRPLITINYGYSLPTPLCNGTAYSFMNYGTSSYMTVHNGSDANEVNVYQQSVSSTSNLGAQHKFKLEYVESTGGYYLRSMSSSGGTNRVLDIVKSDGYVNNGGNVQIYSPNDPLAQHWFIIATGINTFKIVPRTDMSLALTVCPGGNGSSSGTTTTSVGNIFVSTYDDGNSYQQWLIIDETGSHMIGSLQRVQNGTYYLNNSYYGKYLHKSGAAAVNPISGLISTYGDTIRWKITHVGNEQYTIQSADDTTKYLYSESSTSVVLSSEPSIRDNCLWTISYAVGGGMLIKNVGTQSYLKQTGTSTIGATASLGTSGTTAYKSCVWRLASTGLLSGKELEDFDVHDIRVDISDTKNILMYKQDDDAMWTTKSDFMCEIISATSGSYVLNWEEGTVTGNNYGGAQYRVTHKVTGLTDTFEINVAHFDEGTYYIKNRKYELFLQIDNDADNQSAAGTIMEQWDFDADEDQKWVLTFVGDGYYKIISALSGLAITVPTNKETSLDVNLILQSYSGSDRQKWHIIQTRNGSYKIKAKSSEGYTEEDLVLDVQAKGLLDSEGGLNIQQRDYRDNDSYGDEWILQSDNYVLPTPLLPQKTNSWCWAASAEMLARTKHPTAANNGDANTILQEQRDAVYHVFGDNSSTAATYDWNADPQGLKSKGGIYVDVANAAAHLVGAVNGDETFSGYASPYLEEDLLHFLLDGHAIARLYGWATITWTPPNSISELIDVLGDLDSNIGGHVTVIVAAQWSITEQCYIYTVNDPWNGGSQIQLTYEELLFNVISLSNNRYEITVWFPTVVTKTDYCYNTLLEITGVDYSSN